MNCEGAPNKIASLTKVLQSGARNNKYRIIHPDFGEELDILCKASSMPGREISTVDIIVKGRKFQMAGDTADEGTWTFETYNTEDFLIRDYFSKMLYNIHSPHAPDYISGESKTIQDVSSTPWYMRDIVIQQLNHQNEVVTSAILTNAFITKVGPIEYQDEIGEISTTEFTFAYSGVDYIGPQGEY